MGYAIELLCPAVVIKSEEYTVSGIVRQLNIDDFTAVCNGGITLEQPLTIIALFPCGSSLVCDTVEPRLSRP